MKVNIQRQKDCDFYVGDVVLTSDGDSFLITYDDTTNNFQALSLVSFIPSHPEKDIRSLTYYMTDGDKHEIVRICKSEMLEIRDVVVNV